jgi:alanine racemase
MGSENGNNLGADKIAHITKTIPYEMCCAVADRVQRKYLN